MASFSCHAFAVTKRFRLERIVRPRPTMPGPRSLPAQDFLKMTKQISYSHNEPGKGCNDLGDIRRHRNRDLHLHGIFP